LLALCEPALDRGDAVSATLAIHNTDRAVGTRLGSEVTRQHGPAGLPNDTIQLRFKGSAGQSFGAFIPKGLTLTLEGDANDYLGKGHVDDSTDIAIMLVMILQHAGYDAVMSISAPEALKLAHTQHFDLVVSDIAMPEMDGYSLVRALRSIPEYQDVPLVAVTGFDQYDDRERALAAGFNTHVRKPIHPEMFMELIEKFRSQ
jgi:CheY-like chemotaxis protein